MMKKLSLKKIILSVLAALCFALALASFGRQLNAPWKTAYRWNCPNSWCASENGGAVVDAQRQLITFLDSGGMITNQVRLSGKSPIDKASDVFVRGGTVYVSGSVLAKDGRSVVSDRIISYDLSGRLRSVLFTMDSPEGSSETWSHIMDVKANENGVFAAVMLGLEDGYKVQLLRLDGNGGSEILFEAEPLMSAYSVSINPEIDRLAVIDMAGALEMYDSSDGRCVKGRSEPGTLVSCLSTADDGSLLYSDVREERVYLDDDPVLEDVLVYSINIDGSTAYMCDSKNDCLISRSFVDRTTIISDIAHFSSRYYLLNLLRVLSVAFLVVLALSVLAGAIVRAVRAKNFAALKRAAVLTFFALCVTGVAFFYSLKIYRVQMDNMAMFISSVSDTAAKTYDRGFGSILKELEFREDITYDELLERSACYSELESFFTACISSTDGDVGDYFCYYIKDKKGYVLVIDTDREDQIGTPCSRDTLISSSDSSSGPYSYNTVIYRDENSRYLAAFRYILDGDGNETGLLEYGIDYTPYRQKLIRNCLETAMTLLVIACALYLLVTEVKSLNAAFAKKKTLSPSGGMPTEAVFIRQYAFILYFISTIDAVVAALIVMELCEKAGFDSAGSVLFISALPTVMYLGGFVGSLVFTSLISRVNVRRLASGSFVVASAMLLAEGIGVKLDNIYIYFLARFAFYAAQDILFVLVSSVSARAGSESDTLECHRSCTWASVSAGIISGVVAGYAAQYISNESVYFISAAFGLLGVLVCLLIFPKGKSYGSPDAGREKLSVRGVGKYISSPEIIAYILFLTLPLAIFKQYKSMLFPLVSSEYKLPKVYITNLYVFARTLNVMVGSRTSGLLGGDDYRSSAIKALVLCSLMFAGFALNASILWAVIMIFVTDLYVKNANPLHKMLHLGYIKKLGINIDKATGLSETISPLVSCIQTPLVAFFLRFNTVSACLAVGAFGLLCAGLFALITRLSAAKRKSA